MMTATLPTSPYVKPAEPTPNSTPEQVTNYLRWAQADASWLNAWAIYQTSQQIAHLPPEVPIAAPSEPANTPVPTDPPVPLQPGPTPTPGPTPAPGASLELRTLAVLRDWKALLQQAV